jgi:type I restriction enzyme M protein
MSTNAGGEGQIRARIVEADLVSAMVALPTQLFRSTGIPVCLWIFAKQKKWATDRSGQVLFLDARNLGHMVDRAERALSDEDIALIAGTYRAWRGTVAEETVAEPVEAPVPYADVPGFCYSATLAEIKDADYALTPGRYVGTAAPDDVGEDLDEKIAQLTRDLFAALDESARLDGVVRDQLGRLS